jgi:hypothetical protein
MAFLSWIVGLDSLELGELGELGRGRSLPSMRRAMAFGKLLFLMKSHKLFE